MKYIQVMSVCFIKFLWYTILFSGKQRLYVGKHALCFQHYTQGVTVLCPFVVILSVLVDLPDTCIHTQWSTHEGCGAPNHEKNKAQACAYIFANSVCLIILPSTKWPPFWQTFSNAFSWIKMIEFWFKFHSNLFPRVPLTTNQHRSR